MPAFPVSASGIGQNIKVIHSLETLWGEKLIPFMKNQTKPNQITQQQNTEPWKAKIWFFSSVVEWFILLNKHSYRDYYVSDILQP